MLMALSNTGQMSGSVPVLAAQTASFVQNAQSASYVLTAQTASFVLNAQSASYVLNAQSSSYVLTAQTASYVLTAQTASFVANAESASNAVAAQTASFANAFTVASTLTAQTLVVQTITSSVDFVTGSTRFGSLLSNTHVFSGSVTMNPGGLFVSGSGLVGIGTTNPSAKLHVQGTSYFFDQSIFGDKLGIGLSNPTSTLHVSGTTGGVFEVDGAGVINALFVSASGRIGIGNTTPTETLFLQDPNRNPTIGITHAGGGSYFMKFQQFSGWNQLMTFTSAASYMGINTSGPLILNESGSNVGVGTTAPSMKLDVSGSGLGGGIRSMGASGASGGKGVEIGYELGDFGTVLAFDRTGGVFKQLRINDLIHVGTGSIGNVGIGYTAPTAKLQVSGTIAAGSSTTGWGRFSYDATTNQVRIQASKDGTDSVSLSFYTQASGGGFAERMIITGSYVGIGTSDPGQTLEVRSVDGQGIRFKNAGSSDKRWDFVGSGNDFRINEAGVGAAMAFKAGGNIGIGMTSPDGRLTVTSATAGPYGTGTPDIAIGGNIGGSTTALQIYRTAATGGSMGIDSFRAGTSGAPLLLNAANGGRVGIGTTSPDEALHVTNTGSDTVMKLGGGGAARDCNFTMFSQSAGNTVQAIHYNGAMAFYSNKFNIASNGNASLVGSLTQNTSDIRLKTNVTIIENAIDKIKQLSGFTYNWNLLANELGGFDTTIKEIGVAAQSVKEVVPEAVFPAPFDNGFNPATQSYYSKSGENYLTVQYEKLVPLLIEGIKELKAENDTLKEILQRNNIQ
jgi:hypothetical protein